MDNNLGGNLKIGPETILPCENTTYDFGLSGEGELMDLLDFMGSDYGEDSFSHIDQFLTTNQPIGDSVDCFLNKPDGDSYVNSNCINNMNGNLNGNLNGNQQMMVSNVPLQQQEIPLNNMNQSIQPNEVITR